MPTLIDYPTVLKTMELHGFKSLYFNSGAFGFANPTGVSHAGWITSEDPTLRPEMRALTIRVHSPAELTTQAWQSYLPGVAWIMPMSHWAYELDFGSREWMPAALREIGIDPAALQDSPTGIAIQFQTQEIPPFQQLLGQLLGNLKMSDFMLAFPGHPALCTIHHHRQLWWTSNDPKILENLRKFPP